MKSEMLIIAVLAFLWVSPVFAQMDHSGHNMQGRSGMGPGQISIPKEKQQLIGVKSEIARVRELSKLIRTVGIVAYDPELYAAQNEYVQSLQAKEKAGTEFSETAKQMVEASYLKLRRMGLSDEQIKTITGKDDSLIVGSFDGKVWIYGKIYENDIPQVRQGLMVHATSKNLPGRMFMGEIVSVDTVIDEMTRSLRIRTLVNNEEGLLKPNMYLDLAIESPLGSKLAVPNDAILDTGEHQIVFVDQGKGIIEKREVVVGQKADGLVEIVSGLKPGEKVIISGNFLIDSESKLRSTGGGHRH